MRRLWSHAGSRAAHLAGWLLLSACLAGPARAETEVDLALVIAVDVSYSMDPEEQLLQREGFIQAFRSPEVQGAIRRGAIGRIAVAYVEWAGSYDQRVVLPWSVIDGPEAAMAFAASLSQKPTRRASRTSISGAIDFSVQMLVDSDLQAARQVIDISGDGPNNQGRPVTLARDQALARGITINGLPIMLKVNGAFDIPDLDGYYRSCVIGGTGAFLVPVRSREQFVEAVKTKIVLEVAAAPDTPPQIGAASLVVPAQNPSPPANCLVGEMQWRERMGN